MTIPLRFKSDRQLLTYWLFIGFLQRLGRSNMFEVYFVFRVALTFQNCPNFEVLVPQKGLTWFSRIRPTWYGKDPLACGRSCLAVIMTSPKSNGDPWFWTCLGDDEHEPIWGYVCFVIHLIAFLVCQAGQGAVKWWRNQSFLPCWNDIWRRPHRPKIDVSQKFPTPYSTFKSAKST